MSHIDEDFNNSDYPISDSFQLVASHYDSLMRGVPYGQWIKYIHTLLGDRSKSVRNVLDVACGTGNMSEVMAKEGWSVTGIDLSAAMIDVATKKPGCRKLGISYFVQDVCHLDLAGQQFDLATAFFDSLNYILEPERLLLAFHRIYSHLNPGGCLIFDMNAEYALANGFFDQNNTFAQSRLRYAWKSDYDPKSRICTVAMRFFHRGASGVDEEFREVHQQYAYRHDEIYSMLETVGFVNVVSYEAYTKRPVVDDTDRIYFMAAKPL